MTELEKEVDYEQKKYNQHQPYPTRQNQLHTFNDGIFSYQNHELITTNNNTKIMDENEGKHGNGNK